METILAMMVEAVPVEMKQDSHELLILQIFHQQRAVKHEEMGYAFRLNVMTEIQKMEMDVAARAL